MIWQKQRKASHCSPLFTLVCSLTLATICLSSTSAATNQKHAFSGQYNLPSLTAVLRSYSTEMPDVFTESWVTMAPQGMRVTDLTTETEIVKNFVTGKVWMVNRKKKNQYEVDISAIHAFLPDFVPLLVGPETQTNILGRSPCFTWSQSLRGERVWRGQIVEEWVCTEASGVVVSQQLYSKSLGIVVRVLHPDSTVEELRNIAEQDIDVGVFQRENTYQSVGFEEFFDENRQLSVFSE